MGWADPGDVLDRGCDARQPGYMPPSAARAGDLDVRPQRQNLTPTNSPDREPRGCAMPAPVSLLMIQFLDWVASRPRTYSEATDAWRTSCPRLSVWEDALIAGFTEVNAGG